LCPKAMLLHFMYSITPKYFGNFWSSGRAVLTFFKLYLREKIFEIKMDLGRPTRKRAARSRTPSAGLACQPPQHPLAPTPTPLAATPLPPLLPTIASRPRDPLLPFLPLFLIRIRLMSFIRCHLRLTGEHHRRCASV
jgi:hypothetical protein